MKRIIIAMAAGALVAGCSGGNADADGDGAVSMKEAAKKAESAGLKPEPGLYKTTVTMAGLDIPGLPPEMADHGAGMTTTVEDCLTAADVDKGFEELIKQGQDGECSYESFNIAGGKFDAVMVCKTPQGSTKMEMAGTATPTRTDLEAKMAMNFEGVGEGTMTFTSTHERIGDCPAK